MSWMESSAATPALQTSTSMRLSKNPRALATAASTWSTSRMSQGSAMARPPRASTSSTVSVSIASVARG